MLADIDALSAKLCNAFGRVSVELVQNGATSTMLLTRYRGNTEVVHTTQAQFNSGTRTQVLTTNTSGGEVQLEGWSAPTTAATVALSKSGLAIVATGTRAYVGTINSATTEFRIYNIVNPAAPVLSGSLEIGFDVNAIALYGNYAFLALNNKNDELEVVDVSNPAAPSQAALLNLAGNNVGAASVAVSPDGTKLYLGKLVDGGGPEFFVIDISTPTAPAVLGSLELTANVNGISIVGNSAYLATSDNVKELNVINISNPAAPSSAGVFSTPGNVDGVSVFATSTTVFLGTLNSASQEFFILNAATPSAITQIGSFEVTRSVFSIYVSSNVAFLGSDAAGKQVQILNLYNYTTPTLFTSINTGQNVLSVFFQGQYLYAADVTDFRTILGNTAADFFSDGTFESPTIDPGASVAYNYLTWSTTTPASTNVRFQVAANTDNKSWNNYVGPDGTSATYYIAPGAIPLSIAGNRYFRWKAYFNTSLSGTTPILQDVTVNYSP